MLKYKTKKKTRRKHKAEHYFTKRPSSRFRVYFFADTVKGIILRLKGGSGVFSAKHIDNGSKLLIESMIIPLEKASVLDLGCGYGVIGIMAKKLFPGSSVYMTDINERACELAKDNLELNRVKAIVKQGSMFEAFSKKSFDVILLNPPQTAGKDLCLKMIRESVNHLKKGGSLQMVVRHRKGGKSLFREMKNVFKDTKILAKQGGYRVYYGEKG